MKMIIYTLAGITLGIIFGLLFSLIIMHISSLFMTAQGYVKPPFADYGLATFFGMGFGAIIGAIIGAAHTNKK